MKKINWIFGLGLMLSVVSHAAHASDGVVKCKIQGGEIRLKAVTIPLIYSFPHPMVGFFDNFLSGELSCNTNSIMEIKDDQILTSLPGLACVGAREFLAEPKPVIITFQKAGNDTTATLTYHTGEIKVSEACRVEFQ